MTESEKRILKLYFKEESAAYRDAVKNLENNVPIAYIVGEVGFYGEMYYVTSDTLIPRPDTEHVVEHVINNLKMGGKLLDLCTGSGCIGISSLCHTSNTTALMVDISKGAVNVAVSNAKRNGVSDRCRIIEGDINTLIIEEKFDVISSNPPYVKTDVIKTLEKECSYEPYIAFDGGNDGMDFYRTIIDRFGNNLNNDGCFVFEIGYDQRKDIITLAFNKGYSVTVFKDYGKNDRVAVLKKC